MISKFKSYDSEFTKVDVILEKSNAIDVQTSAIKAGQQEIKSRNSKFHNHKIRKCTYRKQLSFLDMQTNIDRSTNEIKLSIGVDGATQGALSTISNGKLS